MNHLWTASVGAIGLIGSTIAVWTATLEGKDDYPTAGSARVESAKSFSRAVVSVRNARAGAILAWFVYQGRCEQGAVAVIVGAESSYQPIQADQRGDGSAAAVVGVSLDARRTYSVRVHSGASKNSPVIACGDLTLAGE